LYTLNTIHDKGDSKFGGITEATQDHECQVESIENRHEEDFDEDGNGEIKAVEGLVPKVKDG
jgi:hypothetical protein